jgi:thiol-disulfide isomerase/thioredoxin
MVPALNKKISGLLVLVILYLFAGWVVASEELVISDAADNDLHVQVYPADGNKLLIWLVDHDTKRQMFEDMLVAVNKSGFEIWRVDLLGDYFLPRSSENERTLPGDGVEAILAYAHDHSDKSIMLVAYDRMPVTLLRGVHQWQKTSPESRLSGAVLFYPNLFGPAPVAGEDPVIDPAVSLTNIPVVIYQPDSGSQRWRLAQVLDALWNGGSAAFAYMVPHVRDWFFMGDIDHGKGDKKATTRIPSELHAFHRLMESYPKPVASTRKAGEGFMRSDVKELVKFKRKKMVPGFSLYDLNNEKIQWEAYKGKVTLVNFWATWCPPCVEEVPSLNQLAARYANSDFEVVSIDFRETREQLTAFTEKIPVDFPVLFDLDGKTSINWKVFSFPSSFIVDRQGYIRYSANRAIDWNTENIWQVVDALLAE